MKTEVAEKLLNLAKKEVTRAEAAFSVKEGRMISFEDNCLKTVQASFSSGVCLRVIQRGRVGVAATNKLGESDKLVTKALAVSEFGPKAHFEFPSRAEFPKPQVCDSSIIQIADRVLVERGERIIEKVRAFGPKIMTDVEFGVGAGESILLNSSGLQVEQKAAEIGFGVEGKLIREGDILRIGEGNESRRDNLDIDFYVERLLDKFKKARKIVKIKSGRYPVDFTPDSFGSILGFVIEALNGKAVVKKSSRLIGKLGHKVFDKRLTVVDDGTLDWKMGSGECDDEGVAVQPLILIENGMVRNFFYDLQTAGQMKVRSTGHGSRVKAAALAVPNLHNTLVKEGREPYGAILKNIRQGIVAEQLLGVGQDNPFNGDFSFNLHLGYKIENGEIVGRVKDTMIAGNAFELLKSGVGEMSKETEWVGNSFRCPYVVLEGLTVNSK
jgi:PmbA protein